jgi:hypothetical protein
VAELEANKDYHNQDQDQDQDQGKDQGQNQDQNQDQNHHQNMDQDYDIKENTDLSNHDILVFLRENEPTET